MTTYNIIRKHSSDTNTSRMATVRTVTEAKQYIKAEIAVLDNWSTPHTIAKLGAVTNIKFEGAGTTWSIGYWYEKA